MTLEVCYSLDVLIRLLNQEVRVRVSYEGYSRVIRIQGVSQVNIIQNPVQKHVHISHSTLIENFRDEFGNIQDVTIACHKI